MENKTTIIQAVMDRDGHTNVLTMGEAPNMLAMLQALVEKIADRIQIDGKPADFMEVLLLINNGHETMGRVDGKEGQE